MAKRGETKETIINAAEKLFFKNGFERTTVKMILEEARVVTGSFYHFFPSKEMLFEDVVERFLIQYERRIRAILENESLSVNQIIEGILREMSQSAEAYYNVLEGDRLHWTIQSALHERTLTAMIEPLSNALARLKECGEIKSNLNVGDRTLAAILIKGSAAIIYSEAAEGSARFRSENIHRKLTEFWKHILRFS